MDVTKLNLTSEIVHNPQTDTILVFSYFACKYAKLFVQVDL